VQIPGSQLPEHSANTCAYFHGNCTPYGTKRPPASWEGPGSFRSERFRPSSGDPAQAPVNPLRNTPGPALGELRIAERSVLQTFAIAHGKFVLVPHDCCHLTSLRIDAAQPPQIIRQKYARSYFQSPGESSSIPNKQALFTLKSNNVTALSFFYSKTLGFWINNRSRGRRRRKVRLEVASPIPWIASATSVRKLPMR